jgi:hypothetical protein
VTGDRDDQLGLGMRHGARQRLGIARPRGQRRTRAGTAQPPGVDKTSRCLLSRRRGREPDSLTDAELDWALPHGELYGFPVVPGFSRPSRCRARSFYRVLSYGLLLMAFVKDDKHLSQSMEPSLWPP